MAAPSVSSAPATTSAVEALPTVTATVLKNQFSEVARRASREPLAITRHNRREFVILTSEHYNEIQRGRESSLADLTAEFDQLVARLQSPAAQPAADALFAADAKALGKAAQKTSRRTRNA